ncbi:hypothetical protein COCNU_02G005680 [Cocos nucifera]|uniref:Uncharacterized protein n=1 Tax=Cocos nucifera TaxID=13894 RepID=A0A8K0HY22_COCNU|nr:hypothetical protein COCNU_02G005680 [Cocos nucifera]
MRDNPWDFFFPSNYAVTRIATQTCGHRSNLCPHAYNFYTLISTEYNLCTRA